MRTITRIPFCCNPTNSLIFECQRLVLFAVASIAAITPITSVAPVAAAHAAPHTATTSSSARTRGRSVRLLALFGFRFRRIVDQQSLERQ